MSSTNEKHRVPGGHEHKNQDIIDHTRHEQEQIKQDEQEKLIRQNKSHENQVKIRELISKEASPANKINLVEKPTDNENIFDQTQHSLKLIAYERTLAKIQHHLPKPIRTFSLIVHTPVVDTISTVSANTIARPAGFLGGGIFAFIGSLVILYQSKHYGFEYNYSLFFILIIAGYVLGTTCEFMIWLIYSRKHRN